MKIIGNAADNGYIVEMSREEMYALAVPPFSTPDVYVGNVVDILTRLSPTVKFEQSARSGPHMVESLRQMADELETGLASLRTA